MLGDDLVADIDELLTKELDWEVRTVLEFCRDELAVRDTDRAKRLHPLAQWADELSHENQELKEKLALIEDAYEEDVMAVARARRTP